MKKRWIIRQEGDTELSEKLSQELGVDKIIANLLINRGITDYDKAKSFFRPELTDLHDPFLMKDMDIAVDRLNKAIEGNEKILIYGDYDVDGTTAVALMYSYLKKFSASISYYIPDRYLEGYGISTKGIDHAVANNCTLIIALDCGIKANDKVQYATQNGVDFIICDHHLPADEIPVAVAVLDPKRSDCSYPFKELSGCGVGYKFIQAFIQKNNLKTDGLNQYIDLVAVSIASDIVPITGENRILAYYGLKKINSNPIIGLKALIKLTGIEERDICINDLVFVIGPRINAAGRIEAGSSAVELLVSDDETVAFEHATNINTFNNERKEYDKNITEEAILMIQNNQELIDKKTTVLFNPEWHKGVIGIVASRLLDAYYRPTVLLTESNGLATGSARSVEGFDLYAAIDACSELLEGYGGHMYAAGLSMKLENLPLFQKKFEEVVSSIITPDQLIPYMDVDAEIQLSNISPKLFRILKQFQPFGPGNMRPIFCTKSVRDIGWSKLVGQNKEHLKIDICEKNNSNRYSGICFNQADSLEIVKSEEGFDICYVIDENNFQGKTTLQLRVRDIR
ncbi:MAG: single-stranded-DNA-specific exonuclease RecJ [Bacteroidota bacterium]